MLNSLPVRLLWRSFHWLTRLAIVVSITFIVLAGFAIIALRYWVLPDIEQYHDQITASLAYEIGNPVTVGRIEGDWQGFQPRIELTDVRILDEQRLPALVLQRIDGSISWMSLLTLQLRLASLEIDKPELLVRRNVLGNVFIGGVALAKKSGSNDLADWLLHQSRMVVHNALIVWVDEMRDAPPLVLQQVDLRIESQFSHHRFALRALPPEGLATPLDVRGDFHGSSFDDTQEWHGNIFTQLDFTDLTAWRSWIDLPGEFSLGRGALRGWLNFADGKIGGITADLALYNAAAKLGENVPEMVLTNLRGRATWQAVQGGFEVSTKGLALRLENGLELQPTDFYFRTSKAVNEQAASGEIRANVLQLDDLASLAKYLPLETGLRDKLDAYAPSGRVANLDVQWQGAMGRPEHFKIRGRFADIAIRQNGKMPGFSGLTMDVDGSDVSGRLNVNAHQMIVDAPGVMREPIPFATLTGQVTWQHKGEELAVNINNATVVNEDLAGNVHGSYQTKFGTLGVLDLTANLTRGDIRRAARYTPLIALNHMGNDWLNGALLAGHTEDFRLRIKGNLSDFPLDGTKPTLFQIDGHAKDAVLEFDKNWPRIENITGSFLIHDNRLEIKSPSAIMAGANLQNVTVALPDMMNADLPLEIKGEAAAASNVLLQFIQKSPVRGYIDGFTDGMHASGKGHLELFVRVPLQGSKPVKVSGMVSVQDNDIDLGGGVPLLRKTRGALSFTESGMQANGIQTEILGGAARINMQTADGGAVHATVQGHLNLDTLHKTESLPLLNYLHGSTVWDMDVSVVKKSAQVTITSNLQGVRSNLPQPFAKQANDILPLRVEKRHVSETGTQTIAGQDRITVQLGKLVNADLLSVDDKGASVVKRGTIFFGEHEKQDEIRKIRKSRRAKDGIWLAGSLPELSMEGWGGLSSSAGNTGPALSIAGASLDIEKLTGYGQNIEALHIDANQRGDGIAAQLSSNALNGEVVWQPHGFETGSKVSVHLRNLQWEMDGKQLSKQADSAKPMDATEPAPMQKPGDIPALELTIEDMQLANKQIGRFEMVGHPDKSDWRLRRLRITNPDGDLLGDGVWHGATDNEQTQINLTLDISDAGKILARSGYPNTVRNGSGKLSANLSWAGRPDEFRYATLNGTLKVDATKGQFLKMDPGAGKLLSILSMQALPKHITTLDFTDVFSKGFQFDNIIGDAAIKNGVMNTQEFHIYGSAAKVALKGNIDLNRETQNLSVKIFPAIGDSVSLLAVFAINPAAGIAGLIADKLLGNPLDKLVSFEYNISGSWYDPTVVKVGGVPAQAKQDNQSE